MVLRILPSYLSNIFYGPWSRIEGKYMASKTFDETKIKRYVLTTSNAVTNRAKIKQVGCNYSAPIRRSDVIQIVSPSDFCK